MNPSILIIFQWLLHILFISTSATAVRLNDIPRLSPTGPLRGTINILRSYKISSASGSSDQDFQTFYYNQTLDHFSYTPESYSIFRQRYVINSKYWGGANASAPIFAYLGAEEALDGELGVIGFLTDNAAHFKALLVYIEHRYYGESVPFKPREEAFKNASTFGYFNSAQALADYAEILIHVKEQFQAQNSPVIVVGGSYGGSLAAWFRLKYPHVAIGALASSAPLRYFDDIIAPQNGYYSIVTKDYREASETCYQTIKNSWAEIDRIASMPDGFSILSKTFNTCNPLNNSQELKSYLDSMYSETAQYDAPPRYPVALVCGGIDGTAGNDTLAKIFGGVAAYQGNKTCYVNEPHVNAPTTLSEGDLGWTWQTCSEMVLPIAHGNDSMFPSDSFDLNNFSNVCINFYGVAPRPHWVTSYYGGHDIKLVLKRFASNIIFSNGLRDPYSSGGVLEDISASVVAVKTVNGSHCLDLLPSSQSDPEWLVGQRETEVKTIEGWITAYYADLNA